MLLEILSAAANLVMAGAAIWGVRAWRQQSEWNRERDTNHATAVAVLRATHRARGAVVMAAHLGPLIRPILSSEDSMAHRRLTNEMDRLAPMLEGAQELLIEAVFEARVAWGEQERGLQDDLRYLNRIVEGTRNALARLVLDVRREPVDQYDPFPMPWDWTRMIEGEDSEWQKMRHALLDVVKRIEARIAPHVATRGKTKDAEMATVLPESAPAKALVAADDQAKQRADGDALEGEGSASLLADRRIEARDRDPQR